MGKNKLGKIGVLAGGPSSEREISLRSGRAIYDALVKEGCDAIFIDVGEDIYDILKRRPMDVAFIALHGKFGEDGTVQRMLDRARIPYTGSGPEASRLALDKIASKEVFKKHGIPTAEHVVVKKSDRQANVFDLLPMPVVVKPQFEGSSIGLSIVRDKSALPQALDRAFDFGDKAIVESFISGRELTVGILNDEPLPVVEIVTKTGVYDYTAKYEDPETKYLVPAPLDHAMTMTAKRMGMLAHRCLGCRSFSRVDMMADRSGRMFVLEVNTIPGMTQRSLLPKAALAAGFDFGPLCVKLVKNALDKAGTG
jgi:D-alanine-D-alanine ligase